MENFYDNGQLRFRGTYKDGKRDGLFETFRRSRIARAIEDFWERSDNDVQLEEIGNTATYLISEMSKSITGEIHYVDCGFNIIGMPKP